MDVAFLILYFAGMLGIGWYYSSKQTTVKEFVTAGQGLGYWVASFSARTTGESAWLLLGLTGMGYLQGVGAFWVVIGEVLGVAVSWFLIVPRFKSEVTTYNSLTMLDYFEDKLQDHRHHLRYIFTVVLLVMVTLYIAAQLTATGKAFNNFYGMDIVLAQVIGLAVILIYVILGGFRAVAISDFVQGILMLLGLLIVPIYAFINAGGFGVVWDHVATHNPELLTFWPTADNRWLLLMTVLGFLGTGLGFLGSPQVYQRIIALKPGSNLRRASWVAVLYTVLTDTGAVLCGIAGRYYFSSMGDPDTVFPDMVTHLFPPLLVGFFVAIILSAIMSTADSLLILAGTTLIRDCYQKIFRPDLSEKKAVLLLRASTVVLGLIALAVSVTDIRGIYWFALFGWAGIASAFCPPLIITLFWRGTTRQGAATGALVGFGTALIWKWYGIWSLYEMVPAFVISFIATVAVSLYTRKGTTKGD